MTTRHHKAATQHHPGKFSSLQRLRVAARKLFVERGYDKTRPQDIAREAQVANGTFYLHFADKQQAFLDFAEEAQSKLLKELGGQLEDVADITERWRIILETVTVFADSNPGVLQAAFLDPILIAPNDDNAWRLYDRMGHFMNMIIGQSSGEIYEDYHLELISHALCGMMLHATTFAARKGIVRQQMLNELSRFVGRALVPPEKG